MMKKQRFYSKSLILLTILVAFLLLIFHFEAAEALDREWYVATDPSPYVEYPQGIAQDGDYVYIVGLDRSISSTDIQWRIEKRRKDTGAASPGGWQQTENYNSNKDYANAVIADNDPNGFIYIAGFADSYKWRIAKRRKDTGAASPGGWTQTTANLSQIKGATAITMDDTYIYVAGIRRAGVPSYRAHIQKRRKDNGNIIWAINWSPNAGQNAPEAIGQDDNYIYVITESSAVGKFRKSDGGNEWEEVPESWPRSMFVDDDPNGYVYIAGGSGGAQKFIEKRNKSNGGLVWIKTGLLYNNYGIGGIVVDEDYIYISGGDSSSSAWRIEKHNVSDGELVAEALSESFGQSVRDMTHDVDYLYITGDYGYWHTEKWAKAAAYVDIGLRVYDQDVAEPIKIAAEPEGTLTSPLRIAKDGVVYGIVLVDPGDSMDSGVRIQIEGASGPEIKALRKL